MESNPESLKYMANFAIENENLTKNALNIALKEKNLTKLLLINILMILI